MRSPEVHTPKRVADPNRAIEASLEQMSLDIVKIDNVLYENGNIDVIKSRARAIANRANHIVRILQ